MRKRVRPGASKSKNLRLSLNSEYLEKQFVRMFGCDTARIIRPLTDGKMFLLIGRRRSTKETPGQWTKNGRPIDFEYTEERVIASGTSRRKLLASALRYKALLGPDAKKGFEQ